MISEWSHQSAMGPGMARLTTAMTAGSLDAEQAPVSSCMSARPWDALAVKVRTPVEAAPTTALIAECSDSAVI